MAPKHRLASAAAPTAEQDARLSALQAIFLAHCLRRDAGSAQRLIDAEREEADRLVGLGAGLAETAFAAGALAALVAEGHLPPDVTGTVTEQLRTRADADLFAIGLRALHDPRLVSLPLEEFLEATLALLDAVGPLHAPSVWILDEHIGPRLLRLRGEMPSWAIAEMASVALGGHDSAAGAWTVVSVGSFERPSAALAFRVDEGGMQQAAALAASLGRLLSRALERASLYARSAAQTAALVSSSERRVARMGLDLHDGPLQDLALLSDELAELRAAVASRNQETPETEALVARVDDLAALTSHLDDNLRVVANSLSDTAEMQRPFVQTLSGIVRAFGVRAGIEPDVEVTGDVDALSHSQRNALLRVVQECLNNVREHSKANNVRIAITCGTAQVDAILEDDGVGFDVELAVRDAARRGRMGLLGVVERIRLLGGRCDIESRPGAGCRISIAVARWTPEMASTAMMELTP